MPDEDLAELKRLAKAERVLNPTFAHNRYNVSVGLDGPTYRAFYRYAESKGFSRARALKHLIREALDNQPTNQKQ